MRAIDVQRLPAYALGRRNTMWWGTVLLMAIEGTAMVLVSASFPYLRGNFDIWPPNGIGTPDIWWAFAELGLLLVSVVPAAYCYRAALRGALRPMRRGLLLATLLGGVMLGLRAVELSELPFRWHENAYASAFWAILGLQTVHVATAVFEMVAIVVLLYRGPVEKKHLSDVELSVLGWYFVVGIWLPVFALVYLERIGGG